MSAGTIWGFTAGAVLFTVLTVLTIPTINWYNGNGFKLLISSSGEADKNKTVKSPGKYEIVEGEGIDIAPRMMIATGGKQKLFDAQCIAKKKYEDIMCGQTNIYYEEYSDNDGGNVGKFVGSLDGKTDTQENKRYLTLWDIWRIMYKESPGQEFDFDDQNTKNKVLSMFEEAKKWKNCFWTLSGLENVTIYGCLADVNPEWYSQDDSELTEALPNINFWVSFI